MTTTPTTPETGSNSLETAGDEDAATPSASTTPLFALLIGAVLATTSTVFYVLHTALPEGTIGRIPLIALGSGAVFVLAATIYACHPRRMIRRGRLQRVTAADDPEIMAELRALCRQAGVEPEPTFLVAPYDKTLEALTFGHPGRRRIQLSNRLLQNSGSLPDLRRDTVLHELGHLHHHDVDKTYLTIAMWWSFVLSVVPLMLFLAVAPQFLSGSGTDTGAGLRDWPAAAPAAVSLGALTLLVYLTRNALLRARELHADAQAVRWSDPSDGVPLQALRAALRRETAGRFALARRYWHHHPPPRQRIETMDDPRLLVRPRLWDSFCVGVVAAVIMENSRFTLANLMPGALNLSTFLTALLFTAPVAATLVLSVSRTVTATGRRTSAMRVLALPMVMGAGLLTGEAISLINTGAGQWVLFSQYGSDDSFTPVTVLTTAAPLLVGGLLLAVWARSALHRTADPGRRRLQGALIATAVLATTPWMALWLTLRQNIDETLADALRSKAPAAVSMPEGLVEGYATALAWTETLTLWPQGFLFFVASYFMPGVLLGLGLLWLVPIVLTSWRSRANPALDSPFRDVRASLAVAASGTGLWALACAAHVLLARSAYRTAGAREDLEAWGTGSMAAFLAICAAFEALAAGATAVVVKRGRVVFALMTVFIMGTMTTLAVWVGAQPGNCYSYVGIMVEACWQPLSADTAGRFWHSAIILGALAAVPVVLLVAVAQKIPGRRARRVRSDAPSTNQAPKELPGRRPPTSRVGFVLLATAVAAPLVPASYFNHGAWIVLAGNQASAANCLLGTWVETEYRRTVPLDETGSLTFTRSKGVTHRFQRNGTVTLDFGSQTWEWGSLNGHEAVYKYTGTLRLDFLAEDDRIDYEDPVPDGRETLFWDGEKKSTEPLFAHMTKAEEFSCSGDDLRLRSDRYTITLRRAGPPP
ncbi:M48 family metalloprotease [Streptomyces sp. WAC04114]|uniref:M48 family metalloprotease n=1 Tax=Streptomyces sp. WAC04114 TaxID=2867961 RepID=UPI001C8BBC91|nr:M48 family metalloprotease [Streptomyces sp. WAC04114]MBX9362363.1 M48 family metalloprotease [Streptomyces sp. WAC04114]